MKKLYISIFLALNLALLPFEGHAMNLFSGFTSFKNKAVAALSSVFIPGESEVSVSPAPFPCEPCIAGSSEKPLLTGLSSMFTPFKSQSTYSNLYVIGGCLSAAALLYLARPYISKFLSNRFSSNQKAFDVRDKNGRTEWHIAAENGEDAKVIDLIVKSTSNINLVDLEGNTPLHIAVNKGYHKIIGLLVGAGARMDLKNRDGVTPIDIAYNKADLPSRSFFNEKKRDRSGIVDPLKEKELYDYFEKIEPQVESDHQDSSVEELEKYFDTLN